MYWGNMTLIFSRACSQKLPPQCIETGSCLWSRRVCRYLALHISLWVKALNCIKLPCADGVYTKWLLNFLTATFPPTNVVDRRCLFVFFFSISIYRRSDTLCHVTSDMNHNISSLQTFSKITSVTEKDKCKAAFKTSICSYHEFITQHYLCRHLYARVLLQ